MFPILKWFEMAIWIHLGMFEWYIQFSDKPWLDWHTASRLSIAKCPQKCLRTKSSSSSNSTWLDRSSGFLIFGIDATWDASWDMLGCTGNQEMPYRSWMNLIACSTTLESGLISLKMHSSKLFDVQKSSEVWSQPIPPVLRRLLPMGEFSSSA